MGIRFRKAYTHFCNRFIYRMSMEMYGTHRKQKTRKPFLAAGFVELNGSSWTYKWCRRRESNSHGRSPLPPQDSVSTNSTTSANFFYCCGTLSTGISCGAEVGSAVCSDAGMVTGAFESTGNSRGGKVGNGATCTFSMTVLVLL